MKKLKTILNSKIVIIIFLFGIILRAIYIYNNDTFFIKLNTYYGYIESYKLNGNNLSLVINNDYKVQVNYYFKNYDEYNFIKDKIRYGQYVYVKGENKVVEASNIPHSFNYPDYLKKKQIRSVIVADEIIFKEQPSNLFVLKNKINDYLNNFNGLYKALIMGDKNNIPSDIYESFQYNGISHLLAISGMHLQIIILLINKVINKLNCNSLIKNMVIILFILFFLFLTNYTSSLLRAGLLYLLMMFNQKCNFFNNNIIVLIYVLIILGIIKPLIIFDIGFIYSFLCTMALFLTKMSGSFFKKLLLTSITTFIATLPFTLYLNYQVNILGIFINLIMVPFLSVFLFPLMLITLIFPIISNGTEIFINIFLLLSEKLAMIKTFNIIIPAFSLLSLLFMYLILIMVTVKKSFKLLGLLFLYLFGIKIISYCNVNYYVYYLDVGQGHASVIVSPHLKEVIIIDTGGLTNFLIDGFTYQDNNYQAKAIVNFLHSKGISKINLAILTHGDSDHIKNYDYISKNIKVKQVMLNNGPRNEYENKIKAPVVTKYMSKYFSLTNLNNEIYSNENDNSIITLLNINQYNFLFVGDAGNKVLENMSFKKPIYVYLASHHGAKDATSLTFFNNNDIRNTVISAGLNNRYNHPSDYLLNILKDKEINYYLTSKEGTIIIKINKNGTISNYKS